MKKLYEEFFYIPKHAKIRDKVMITRAAVSVIVMLFCLAAMGITAYAYFSHDVTSNTNSIKAANFEAEVSISITESDNSTPVDVAKKDNVSYTADLKADKTYTVILSESSNSTATTGFCVVTAIGCTDVYHTQQLGADASKAGGVTQEITFQLTVTDDTTVTFLSHWGTSSHYDAYKEKGEADKLYITDANNEDNAIIMVINGITATISTPDAEVTTAHTTTVSSATTTATSNTTTGTSVTSATTAMNSTTTVSSSVAVDSTQTTVTATEHTSASITEQNLSDVFSTTVTECQTTASSGTTTEVTTVAETTNTTSLSEVTDTTQSTSTQETVPETESSNSLSAEQTQPDVTTVETTGVYTEEVEQHEDN